MPRHAITDLEILNCFKVMSELRPHLIEDNFLSAIREMESEGYKLAYIENEDNIVAVAGYRISTNLFMGKNLYVDDLVTSNELRSNGYGEKLLSWIRTIAVQNECYFYHLDSGTHRAQAHKFYFKQGFRIASFHFSEQLEEKYERNPHGQT